MLKSERLKPIFGRRLVRISTTTPPAMWFLQLSLALQENVGMVEAYLKTEHGRYLPHLFQSIVVNHHSIQRYIYGQQWVV